MQGFGQCWLRHLCGGSQGPVTGITANKLAGGLEHTVDILPPDMKQSHPVHYQQWYRS